MVSFVVAVEVMMATATVAVAITVVAIRIYDQKRKAVLKEVSKILLLPEEHALSDNLQKLAMCQLLLLQLAVEFNHNQHDMVGMSKSL